MPGPGFSEILSAVEQGTLDPEQLREQAAQWGAELAAAGVNLDLAPIADVVASAEAAPGNAPIGAYHREFGYDQATVEQHAADGRAFALRVAARHADAEFTADPGHGSSPEGVAADSTTRRGPAASGA